MPVNKRLFNKLAFTVTLLMMSSGFYATAGSFNDTTWRQPVNNVGMDGQYGVVYIYGSLSESACRLSMDSVYQAIDLGNTSTADLQKFGSKGTPVKFDIDLLDCVYHDTDIENFRAGTTIWSTTQPAVKVRFLSPTISDNSNIIQVLGAKGLGLQITDAAGQVIPMGVSTSPQLLQLNSDTLTYFVTPVRTAAPLEAGQYHAVVNFELIYD